MKSRAFWMGCLCLVGCWTSALDALEVAVKESREQAWSIEESRAALEIDGPYEVQLVAAEPLVRDPVEICWDAKGRCFVADMVDYPLGAGEGKVPLSRIVELIDEDGDGRYEQGRIFAAELDHVQGILPYRDGLIATTRTQILWLRDVDGDGVVDERKPLIEGFNPSQSQLQVSSPRWGLDNRVYFNNGLDTKEVYPSEEAGKKLNFARTNFSWDPLTGQVVPVTGFGQFGACFDDWGRYYMSSNRSPVMMAVMHYEAVRRNAHAGITQGWEDIAPSGAESRIYPLQTTHTTSDAHAGTHTSACGIGVYRGDLMPELRGEIFVCDPTGQLVVRYHPEADGASVKATRVGDRKEFLRSKDEWCRPVNVTTGPDGALYVCDMYRRYIDHARFFPESFLKENDIRRGENEGRIWRIVPKGAGAKVRKIEAAPDKAEELVQWLGHENAWQRETAQRLLVEMRDEVILKTEKGEEAHGFDPKKPGTVPLEVLKPAFQEADNLLMKLHVGRVMEAWTGDSWVSHRYDGKPVGRRMDAEMTRMILRRWEDEGRKSETRNMVQWYPASHEAVPTRWEMKKGKWEMTPLEPLSAGQRGTLLDSIERFHPGPVSQGASIDPVMERAHLLNVCVSDEWLFRGVLSGSADTSGQLLQKVFELEKVPESYVAGWAEMLRALALSCAGNAHAEDVKMMLGLLERDKGKLLWWKPALLQGLAQGLPRSGGKLGVGSLKVLIEKPPIGYEEVAVEIGRLMLEVERVVGDRSADVELRQACLVLMGQRPWGEVGGLMRRLLGSDERVQIRDAALGLLKSFPVDKTAPLLYELLPGLGPQARREVVTQLAGGKMAMDFFARIERGEIAASVVDAETRWRYLHSSNAEQKAMAERIFGMVAGDRAAVVTRYAKALGEGKRGDVEKGKVVFMSVCLACHRFQGQGLEVGPDISDVRAKTVEALLTDVLDPNRMVEARWSAYQVEALDGRTLVGILVSETDEGVTLRMPGGVSDSVQRSQIKSMKSMDQSLMPAGLEGVIAPEQMVDLFAFLFGGGGK